MYATPEDLTDLTVTGEATQEQKHALIAAATAKLRANGRGKLIDAWVALGRLDEALVKLVVVEMVQAVLRNPTGQRAGSETTGPFGRSWSWDSAAASGLLSVTSEQLKLLGFPVAGAYTVRAPDTPAWAPDPRW